MKILLSYYNEVFFININDATQRWWQKCPWDINRGDCLMLFTFPHECWVDLMLAVLSLRDSMVLSTCPLQLAIYYNQTYKLFHYITFVLFLLSCIGALHFYIKTTLLFKKKKKPTTFFTLSLSLISR